MPHVFVDESIRRGYILAATTLAPARLCVVRRCLRALRLPGERRVHFQAESEARRRKIISELAALDLDTVVYLARGRDDRARAACLRRLAEDCVRTGTQRLVLESRGPVQDRKDRRIVARSLADNDSDDDGVLAYEHLQSHEEPALWISDAVAWCYGAGGQWRTRVYSLVKEVIDVGAQ